MQLFDLAWFGGISELERWSNLSLSVGVISAGLQVQEVQLLLRAAESDGMEAVNKLQADKEELCNQLISFSHCAPDSGRGAPGSSSTHVDALGCAPLSAHQASDLSDSSTQATCLQQQLLDALAMQAGQLQVRFSATVLTGMVRER